MLRIFYYTGAQLLDFLTQDLNGSFFFLCSSCKTFLVFYWTFSKFWSCFKKLFLLLFPLINKFFKIVLEILLLFYLRPLVGFFSFTGNLACLHFCVNNPLITSVMTGFFERSYAFPLSSSIKIMTQFKAAKLIETYNSPSQCVDVTRSGRGIHPPQRQQRKEKSTEKIKKKNSHFSGLQSTIFAT